MVSKNCISQIKSADFPAFFMYFHETLPEVVFKTRRTHEKEYWRKKLFPCKTLA